MDFFCNWSLTESMYHSSIGFYFLFGFLSIFRSSFRRMACKMPINIENLSCYKQFKRFQMNGDELIDQDIDDCPDTKRLKQFTAKCKFCDENAPEKHFKQGNSTNLKTHLQKVHLFFSYFGHHEWLNANLLTHDM